MDKPPPQRYRIVERAGRLEVIDGNTGSRPASAAERMAAHDHANGHKPQDFASRLADRTGDGAIAAEAASQPPTEQQRNALSGTASPWTGERAVGTKRAELMASPSRSREQRPETARTSGPPRGKSGPMVTGRWWDSKGPRTIQLGEKGRARLSSGFVTGLVVGFFILVTVMIIAPYVLLVIGFVLFRFGGMVLAPIGARMIDEAIKADGGRP